MAKKQTLIDYWSVLDPQQRRLIHDLLRSRTAGRRHLNMGLLPFIPVDEVVRLLINNPPSPWTDMLHKEAQDSFYDNEANYRAAVDARYSRWHKSQRDDAKVYDEIIKILTYKPEPPSHLAAQLQRWQQRNGKEENNA